MHEGYGTCVVCVCLFCYSKSHFVQATIHADHSLADEGKNFNGFALQMLHSNVTELSIVVGLPGDRLHRSHDPSESRVVRNLHIIQYETQAFNEYCLPQSGFAFLLWPPSMSEPSSVCTRLMLG